MLLDTSKYLLTALDCLEKRLSLPSFLDFEHEGIVGYPQVLPHELSEFLLDLLLL